MKHNIQIRKNILASSSNREAGSKRLLIITSLNKRGRIKTSFQVEYNLFPNNPPSIAKVTATYKKLSKAIKLYNDIVF